MPHSTQKILDHANALADRFEAMGDGEVQDATPLRAIITAVRYRANAEQAVIDSVTAAREAGLSWAAIAAVLGTAGQSAREEYGVAPRQGAPMPPSRYSYRQIDYRPRAASSGACQATSVPFAGRGQGHGHLTSGAPRNP